MIQLIWKQSTNVFNKMFFKHRFEGNLFPQPIYLSQKPILEKYNGKPLSDNNLK